MRRRDFILLNATGLAAACLATPAVWAAPSAYARPGLLDLFRDDEQVRQIGRRYIEQHPAEAHTDALEHRLAQTLRGARNVESCIRNEFAHRETVQLNGWILARTEARQCALFALS
ncbi:MAG: hypothetical protein SH809_18030 [Rhodothermales bacterium]|nr:hypothetical protein [Rhodothermales bacterium]